MTGPNWATDTRPRANGSFVSWRTSQPCGDRLHPRADQRDQLADPEQPVVAMAECRQAARRRQRARANEHVGHASHDRRPPRPLIEARRVSSTGSSASRSRRRSRRASASATIVVEALRLGAEVAIARSTRAMESRRRARRPPGPPWPGTPRGLSRGRPRPRAAGRSPRARSRRCRAVRGCGGSAPGPMRRRGGSRLPSGQPGAAGRSPRNTGSRAWWRRPRRRLPGCAAGAAQVRVGSAAYVRW